MKRIISSSSIRSQVGQTYENINTGMQCVVTDRFFNEYIQKIVVKYECEGEIYTDDEDIFMSESRIV